MGMRKRDKALKKIDLIWLSMKSTKIECQKGRRYPRATQNRNNEPNENKKKITKCCSNVNEWKNWINNDCSHRAAVPFRCVQNHWFDLWFRLVAFIHHLLILSTLPSSRGKLITLSLVLHGQQIASLGARFFSFASVTQIVVISFFNYGLGY